MKPIIAPVPIEKLEAELTDANFLRHTNYGNNEVYVFTAHDSPNLMQEIGRLREVAFRQGGGGTGKEADIDAYDIAEKPYQQLIVWNPQEREIVGGYRFFLCSQTPLDNDGNPKLATAGLFKFSEAFKKDYLPYSIELGRSFVQPNYQAANTNRKSLFALDNLWDGLGAITLKYPSMKYLFGKVTMYTTYNPKARDLVLFFLKTQFPSQAVLLEPHEPLPILTPEQELAKIFDKATYRENYRILSQRIRELGETIPPLINSYMNISSGMQSFGTAMNHHFGGVEETAILITMDNVYESKKRRHVTSYSPSDHR